MTGQEGEGCKKLINIEEEDIKYMVVQEEEDWKDMIGQEPEDLPLCERVSRLMST